MESGEVGASMDEDWFVNRVMEIFPPEEEKDDFSEDDCLVQTSSQDPNLSTSSGSSCGGDDDSSEDAVARALAGLSKARPLKLSEAYELVCAVAQDDARVKGLPTRSQASPLVPSRGMFYVVKRRCVKDEGARPKSLRSSPDAVKVAFQSVLNAEAWWEGDFGVVSRPMSRGRRHVSQDVGDHGFRGRMYTLVARASDGPLPSKRRRLKSDEECREDAKFTAMDVSIVHAWRASADEDDRNSELFQRLKSHHVEERDHLHIRGDLRVDGKIYGQLATEPFAADYAEWFKWGVDEIDEPPPCASVVQLQSPEQRLSLDTTGPGPCLIVSTKPAVAAGVPTSLADARKGALVAFLGQVPVRTRGRVDCGDQLVPSGKCDGCAVSLEQRIREYSKQSQRLDTKRLDNLGVAMESARDNETILCFVRWNHAVRRDIAEVIEAEVDRIESTWQRSLIDLITAVACIAVLIDAVLVVCTVFRIYMEESEPPDQQVWLVLAQSIGFTNFCLIVFLFMAFARYNTVDLLRLKGLVAFWIAGVGIAVVASAVLNLRAANNKSPTYRFKALTVYFVWKGYNIAYNCYIMHLMAQFRKKRSYSYRVERFMKAIGRCFSGPQRQDSDLSSDVALDEDSKEASPEDIELGDRAKDPAVS